MNDKMIRIHHKYRQKRKKEAQKELRKKTSPSLLARPTFASSLMGGVFYEHVVILLMTTWYLLTHEVPRGLSLRIDYSLAIMNKEQNLGKKITERLSNMEIPHNNLQNFFRVR